MKQAIVMGAGFGGLAAALRLLAKGYKVTILEATSQPGGRASVFKKNGFVFDAGPTVLTAPYLIDELFALFNKSRKEYIELLPVDPFYRVEFPDGSRFDYVGDEAEILRQIKTFNPEDVEGYKKLAKKCREIFEIGYLQLSDRPFESIVDMIKIVPKMIGLQNYHSVYSMVAKYIKDERLRQVFSFQPLLIGGNPFSTTSIYLLIHWLERKWGVFYPVGGTTALVNALVRLFKEHGGELVLDCPIENIQTSNGTVQGVLCSRSRQFSCDILVCNGDPSYIYKNLLNNTERKKHQDNKISKRKPSPSLFVCYFGTNKIYNNIAHHTIILGPRYKGLLDDIFNHKKLANDFSLYLHAPSKTYVEMAPPGKEGFYVLSPVPNNLSKIDWSVQGPIYQQKILEHLHHNQLPGLLDHLEFSFFITPDYFQDHLRSIQGAAFGLEPNLLQSAYFRYHNRSEDIKGLFFVGASTHPGAGIPGVLSSAKVLERVIDSGN